MIERERKREDGGRREEGEGNAVRREAILRSKCA